MCFKLPLSLDWLWRQRRILRAVLFSRLLFTGCAFGFCLFRRIAGFGHVLDCRFNGTDGIFVHFNSGDTLSFFNDHRCVFRLGFGVGHSGGRIFDLSFARSCFGDFRDVACFAFLKMAKVMTNGNADLFQCLFADAGNLLELLGSHIGKCLDGGDASGDQLLYDAVAQLGNLLNGRRRSGAEGAHLLLDLLALLLFALDIDLPTQQLSGKADVLALLADRKRKLRIVDDHFQLLLGELSNGNAADLGRLQRLFSKGGDLVAEFDDVDFLAAQFADDGLNAHSLHADAGADRVHILIAALDGDLGALAGFAGNGANNDRVVVDLGDFRLKQIRYQLRCGAGDDNLRSLGGAVYLEQHHAHALADRELLQAGLFALGAARFSLAQVVDHILTFNALDGGVQDFLFAVRVFLEDGVTLGFADLLEDDLLGELRGDAAQWTGIAIHADFRANFGAGSQLIGLRQRDLVEGVFNLLRVRDYSLVDVSRDFAGLFIELPAHVFLGLVELARGQGNGLLDRADNDGGVNALFLAEELDALVQNTAGHTLLTLSIVARC